MKNVLRNMILKLSMTLKLTTVLKQEDIFFI